MTTTVVLIRHALPVQTHDQEDFTRPISDKGRVIQKKMNNYLKHEKIIPDILWYSPLKRAEQTAQIVSEDFAITAKEELALGEFFDEEELFEKLPPVEENRCVFLVGHGPQLMRFASYCAGSSCYPSPPTPSSVLVLEFVDSINAGKASFVRYITQDDLTYYKMK